MTAAAEHRDTAERTSGAAAYRCLVVRREREAGARRDGAVVAGNERSSTLAAGPLTRKNQGARISVYGRVRRCRRKVRVLIRVLARRSRELVASAIIDHDLVIQTPVVLRVEGPVRIDLPDVSKRLGTACVGDAEKERSERRTAGVGEVRTT